MTVQRNNRGLWRRFGELVWSVLVYGNHSSTK
jgi:hypothetical protein